MMLYIALTSYATPDKSAKPLAIIKLEKHDREQDPHLGVLSKRDIDKILWNSLDKDQRDLWNRYRGCARLRQGSKPACVPLDFGTRCCRSIANVRNQADISTN